MLARRTMMTCLQVVKRRSISISSPPMTLLVAPVSTIVSDIEVFDGDGLFHMRSSAAFDLVPQILTSFL